MSRSIRCGAVAAPRLRSFYVLAIAAVIAACAGPIERTGQTTIDESFSTGGFRWDDGGTVYLFAKARESKGRVEVCAANMSTPLSALSHKFNAEALGSVIVLVNGERVMDGLSFSNRLPLMDDVRGQPASCARSARAWKADYAEGELSMKSPPMTFVD